jgi:hypothetical protein
MEQLHRSHHINMRCCCCSVFAYVTLDDSSVDVFIRDQSPAARRGTRTNFQYTSIKPIEFMLSYENVRLQHLSRQQLSLKV